MTSDAGAGIRILGSVRSADGKGIVRMEDRYNTDIVDLWSALTDPGRLARWIAEVEGDLRLGGEFHARFTSGWEATLTADAGQTILVIEAQGLSLDQLAAYGAGWQVHVEDLAGHLAGRERCDIATRWSELIPAYRELAVNAG